MKLFTLVFLTFYSLNIFAQTTLKKEFYLDENNKPILLAEFKGKVSLYNKYSYTVVSETDSTLIAKLIFREQTGVLQPIERDAVVKALQQLTGKAIDAS